MTIEFLNTNNLEEILDVAEQSYRESIWANYDFSREYLKNNLIKILDNSNYFNCFYRKDNKLVGYFLARLGRFIFSEALLGMESGVYVLPEHRNSVIAPAMYKEFIAWCNEHKAEPLVEVYFGSDNEKTYEFFKKQGLTECGKVFRGRS